MPGGALGVGFRVGCWVVRVVGKGIAGWGGGVVRVGKGRARFQGVVGGYGRMVDGYGGLGAVGVLRLGQVRSG